MLTVVLWALAGVLSFYGSTRYNEGRLLATEERITAVAARVTLLEANSVSRFERDDLNRRIESIDANQRRMNEKLDMLLMRNGRNGGGR